MSIQFGFNVRSRLLTKRGHARAMRELMRETMETVRNNYWPKHFQNVPETYPGAGGYGYHKRTEKYERYKFRRFGHRRPLVFTGALEQTVRSTAKITATSNRGTLRARSPHFLRLRNRREIEAVSSRERRDLADRFGQRYIQLANSPQYQQLRIRRPVAI